MLAGIGPTRPEKPGFVGCEIGAHTTHIRADSGQSGHDPPGILTNPGTLRVVCE